MFSSSYLAGVEVIGADNGAQRAKVALQKAEGVTMPGCADATNGGNFLRPCEKPLPKAYASLGFSDMDTGTLLLGGLTDVSIVQVMATGTAANNAARSGSARKAFLTLEGVYDESPSTRCVEEWLEHDDGNVQVLKTWWNDAGFKGNPVLLITDAGNADRREALKSAQNISCAPDGAYLAP